MVMAELVQRRQAEVPKVFSKLNWKVEPAVFEMCKKTIIGYLHGHHCHLGAAK
jgi:hypothetical protein